MKKEFSYEKAPCSVSCPGPFLPLLLSACSGEQTHAPAMWPRKAELTPEEENICRLLGADPGGAIFDYAADETVRSLHLTVYHLSPEGVWEPLGLGGRYALELPAGRIALTFDRLPEGMRIALQTENGTSASSHTAGETGNFSDMSAATALAADTAEILYGTEIPPAVQVITAQNAVISYDPSVFFEPERYLSHGYEHVYTITALFCKNP